MRNVLDVYDVELVVDGLVFIGSGREIGKKEYVFSNAEKKVYVLETVKLYQLLKKKGLVAQYEQFLMGTNRKDVGAWLEEKGVARSEYSKCARYCLDCGDVVTDTRSKLAIMEFVKDAYGMPYVPGSSIKGMLRTILLAYDIYNNSEDYRQVRMGVEANLSKRASRSSYLKKEASMMENNCYRTLERQDTRKEDAVNDVMSGLVISDSASLTMDSMVLCQRTELHTDGAEKKINVLREAIRPGTVIKFQLTIDKSICSYTKEYIDDAIRYFARAYYDNFLKQYKSIGVPEDNSVWLGGGCGYVTKTEVYPMFGKREGLDVVVDIFKGIGVPDQHKHYKDRQFGVSPHICKVTYYNRKRLQMGLCHINLAKRK